MKESPNAIVSPNTSKNVPKKLLADTHHWFNKEEEHALQHPNMAYNRMNPIEDIVRNTYAPGTSDNPNYLSLSAAVIHQELKKRFPAVPRSRTPIQLVQVLTATGIVRQHTRLGNVYSVKKVKNGKVENSVRSFTGTSCE